MQRFCLPLCLLAGLLVGCSHTPPYDRQADIEKWLPEYITSEMRRHPLPSSGNIQYDRARCYCSGVKLTKGSEGHYTGEVIFLASKHLQVDVVDEGKNVQFKLSTMNDWGRGRVPPID